VNNSKWPQFNNKMTIQLERDVVMVQCPYKLYLFKGNSIKDGPIPKKLGAWAEIVKGSSERECKE